MVPKHEGRQYGSKQQDPLYKDPTIRPPIWRSSHTGLGRALYLKGQGLALHLLTVSETIGWPNCELGSKLSCK